MSSAALPIALVDDHGLMRKALSEMIQRFGGYDVVLQVDHGGAFVDAVRNGLNVPVVILDLHMPVMDGFQTLEWIRQHSPGTRTLVLTFDDTEEVMVRAIRAGACGFLPKTADPHTLLRALEQVSTLGHYHTEETAHLFHGGRLLEQYEDKLGPMFSRVTDREAEFLRLVCHCDELTYKEISERMGVSPRAVDGYRASLFEKLRVKSKTGLVMFAQRWKTHLT